MTDLKDQKRGRGRPPQERSEQERKMDTLDEMEQRAAQNIKSGQRISLSPKLKLEWNDVEKGFNYQWATDSETYPINLQQMMDAGYTFVRFKHGGLAGEKIIKHSKGCNLYLMRCPDEYFQKDQEQKHKKSIALHQQIMQVGKREYAGESKELGKGKPVTLTMGENPEPNPISLLEGD